MLALVGDGAPGSGISILVSLLNVGERIASSSEILLLFGGNVDEISQVVRQFIKILVKDIHWLVSQIHTINRNLVEFSLGELPNDMKMYIYKSLSFWLVAADRLPVEVHEMEHRKVGAHMHHT